MNLLRWTDVPNCTICNEYLTDDLVFMKCGHVFDKKCIEKWIKLNSICPICKEYTKTYKKLHYTITKTECKSNYLDIMTIEEIKKRCIDLESINEKIKSNLNKKSDELDNTHQNLNHLIKSLKIEQEKVTIFLNKKFYFQMEKEQLEKESLMLKKRIDELSEDGRKLRERNEDLLREEKMIKMRIDIFENHFNFKGSEDIIKINESNDHTLEEKNCILMDLILSLMAKLNDQTDAEKEIINISPPTEKKELDETIDLRKNEEEDELYGEDKITTTNYNFNTSLPEISILKKYQCPYTGNENTGSRNSILNNQEINCSNIDRSLLSNFKNSSSFVNPFLLKNYSNSFLNQNSNRSRSGSKQADKIQINNNNIVNNNSNLNTFNPVPVSLNLSINLNTNSNLSSNSLSSNSKSLHAPNSPISANKLSSNSNSNSVNRLSFETNNNFSKNSGQKRKYTKLKSLDKKQGTQPSIENYFSSKKEKKN